MNSGEENEINIHSLKSELEGLPRWHSGKESTCQCRRCKRRGFSPWIGKTTLEKEMATHSSILAWKVAWMELSGLQSTGSKRVLTEHSTTQMLRLKYCNYKGRLKSELDLSQMSMWVSQTIASQPLHQGFPRSQASWDQR